jgi:ATP-dependent Clp endopeptidase proteolytic subunit ClpP
MMSKEDLRAKWTSHFENRNAGTIATKKPSLQVKQATDGASAEILLYDEIGFWGVTAQDFASQLATITAPSITVRINSPGGDVFDGLAIFAQLKAHAAEINTVVDGWAASAASFIALAGDTVTMAENAFMMIHKAWGLAIGNASDMTDMATTLAKIDGQLASIYAKKTGKTADAMLALMAGEKDGTWFTAQEAKDLGLADAIAATPPKEEPDEQAANIAAARTARVKAMRRRLTLATHE